MRAAAVLEDGSVNGSTPFVAFDACPAAPAAAENSVVAAAAPEINSLLFICLLSLFLWLRCGENALSLPWLAIGNPLQGEGVLGLGTKTRRRKKWLQT